MNIFDFTRLFFDDSDSTNNGENETQTETETKADNSEAGKGGKKSDNSDADKSDEKKYSDKELNEIIDKKFAKWQKQKEAEVDEAKKLANMNAQERVEHERDKLKAELDALKKANTIAEMEKTARSILHESGVNVTDVIVSHLVADDAETTSKNVKAFAADFKAAVQAEVKSQLSHKSPTSGSTGKGMTRAELDKKLDAETDPFKRQQLIRDNIELFSRKK